MTSIWAGQLVRLRGIEPDDWDRFMTFDEHTEHVRSADSLHPPRSAAGYRDWASHQARRTPSHEFQLAIEALPDAALVGSLSTAGTDQRAGRFHYGIAIGHEHQRRGYARDAIRVLLRYMFGELRYHKCEVNIYAFNRASIALHRTLGFREEGRLREHEFFAGRHHDVVLMGMTAPYFAHRYDFPRV